MTESKRSLQVQRETIVRFLQKEFAHLKLKGLIVFDGKHRASEESGLFYPSPLEAAFASKGQTADQFILERLEGEKRPSFFTVVTDDKSLTRSAKELGAHTQTNSAFLRWIEGKKAKKREKKTPEPKDTQQNIDRLLKIFEDRSKEDGSEL